MSSGARQSGIRENGGKSPSSEVHNQAPRGSEALTFRQRFLRGLDSLTHRFSRNRQVAEVKNAQNKGDTGITALSGQEPAQKDLTDEIPGEARDISSFIRETPRYAELPSSIKLSQKTVDGARFLMAHTLYDQTILGERLDASQVEKARQGNLNEAGVALVEEGRGVVGISQTPVELGGKEDGFGYSVDPEAPVRRAQAAGEHVVGTMHTHPYVVGEDFYQEVLHSPPPQPISTSEQELYEQFARVQFEITPPSVSDIALSAEDRRPFDIIVSNKRLYCLISTAETPFLVKTEGELFEEHERIETIFSKERTRMAELGHHPSDLEMERIILSRLEEYCQQFNLGLYISDWGSKASPQQLIMKRVMQEQ